jgi:hypothetical protein
MDGGADEWFDRELAGCSVADERLNKRLRKLVAQMGAPWAKAFRWYAKTGPTRRRPIVFFSNDRVSVIAR